MPTLPSLWMRAGMMPSFALPGEMMPGQFGPMSRDLRVCRNSHARTMSSAGMPSVMQTMSGSSASADSMIASAANGGGTKMSEAFAPVFSTASATVLKMGQPSCVVPPFPGVTPPMILVPYSWQALAWNVPSRPVRPCTMTLVFFSTSMLMNLSALSNLSAFFNLSAFSLLRLCVLCVSSFRCRDYFLRRVLHRLRHGEVQAALLEDLAALLH